MGASNVFSLGRVTATWNSQALGITEECKATFEKITHLVRCEAFASPVDAIDGGWKVSVELMLLERDYAVLDVLDGITKVVGTATTGTKVTFGSEAGTAATQGVLSLVSSVTARATTHDLTIYKAVLDNCSPVTQWKPDEPCQKGFILKFTGIIDSSRTTGDYLASIGVNAASVA